MTIKMTLKGYCPYCCSYGTCDCTQDEKDLREAREKMKELEEKLETAISIAEVLSGAVEYDYHGNVLDPEQRKAISDLDKLLEN